MNQAAFTLAFFGLGMLAMIVPVLLLAFCGRDSHSADVR
jgi:hypothetical protein